VILRPAPVYGPDPRSNLLPLVRSVLAGRPVLVGRGDVARAVVSRTNLAAAVRFALSRGEGSETFNVSDREPLTARSLACLVAEVAGAPPPRSLPLPVAAVVAPLGSLVARLSGRTVPMSIARLRDLRTPVDFPCDRLVAAGFRHPETTREGLAGLVAFVRGGGSGGTAGPAGWADPSSRY